MRVSRIYIKEGSALDLEGFRWRDDNGNETTATWLADQDATLTDNSTSNRRLRALIDVTLGDPPSQNYRLEYQKTGESNSASGNERLECHADGLGYPQVCILAFGRANSLGVGHGKLQVAETGPDPTDIPGT